MIVTHKFQPKIDCCFKQCYTFRLIVVHNGLSDWCSSYSYDIISGLHLVDEFLIEAATGTGELLNVL
ncbi:hypothetical protein P8452_24732 [Trifolium repens]|nr:hypothetical protein P8452_24732 [Trifolium repens]